MKTLFILLLSVFLLCPLFAEENIDLKPEISIDEDSPDGNSQAVQINGGNQIDADKAEIQDLAPSPAAAPDTAPPSPAVKTVEEQRLETLRFGTETEIASLIQILKNEKVSYLDKDLIEIAEKTRNKNILSGVYGFFGEMEKNGLEERAMRSIRERDDEANESVLAAVDYLGRIKAGAAVPYLEELINSGESRFLNTTFRAMGRAAKGQGDEHSSQEELADQVALFLLDYYTNRIPADENRREIISALGETGSREAVSFLRDIVKDKDERAVLRMASLDAISKIGDSNGLEAIIEAVSSTDPNVRSTAIAALGPFSGEAAENAILEGFRDSYYRTRIGAAQAAGKRKLVSAIPFLQYRAEKDDVPTVKDESIKALGAINNEETMAILDSLFRERKNSDRVRLVSAEMLLQNDPDKYGRRIEVELEEARTKRQTPLYNGFIRMLVNAKTGTLEDMARRFATSGGIIEKSLALDLILNNEYRGLVDEVRSLLDEKKGNASIARKARSTLEKLGLETGES